MCVCSQARVTEEEFLNSLCFSPEVMCVREAVQLSRFISEDASKSTEKMELEVDFGAKKEKKDCNCCMLLYIAYACELCKDPPWNVLGVVHD